MASSFICQGKVLSFGSGATEALYKHWLELLEDEPERPGKRILKLYLERMAVSTQFGCGSFGMDAEWMPKELLDMRAAWTLMRLVRATAEDVRRVRGVPADAWDKVMPGGSCTLAERWEELLWQFHRALAAWVLPP